MPKNVSILKSYIAFFSGKGVGGEGNESPFALWDGVPSEIAGTRKHLYRYLKILTFFFLPL